MLDRVTEEPTVEPTLAALLRAVADTRLPTQFYQLLQLAIPLAAQCWSYGWYRAAGWCVVTSLFGIWALCVQRLEDAELEDVRLAWHRIGRRLSKGFGGVLATALAVEAVVRFLAVVFRCPGCAG